MLRRKKAAPTAMVRAVHGTSGKCTACRDAANGLLTMRYEKKWWAAVVLLCWGLAFGAQEKAKDEKSPPPGLGTQYTEEGADTCLGCHDESWPGPVFDIFKTKHANRADKRTPF